MHNNTNISTAEYYLGRAAVYAQLLILLGLPLAFFSRLRRREEDDDVIFVAAFLASPFGIPEAY